MQCALLADFTLAHLKCVGSIPIRKILPKVPPKSVCRVCGVRMTNRK